MKSGGIHRKIFHFLASVKIFQDTGIIPEKSCLPNRVMHRKGWQTVGQKSSDNFDQGKAEIQKEGNFDVFNRLIRFTGAVFMMSVFSDMTIGYCSCFYYRELLKDNTKKLLILV